VIDKNIKTLFWNESLESWFGLKLSLLSIAISMPIVIMALINKYNEVTNPDGFEPASGGLLMVFSVGFDQCTFYSFIFINMMQIRFISFERLMNYLNII
jgi:hypothetical protein